LAKQSVTIEANANDEGHLYGSRRMPDGNHQRPQAARTSRSRPIRSASKGPLKELGLYTVKIHLAPRNRERPQGVGRADRSLPKPAAAKAKAKAEKPAEKKPAEKAA
jgi:hypothetical protein